MATAATVHSLLARRQGGLKPAKRPEDKKECDHDNGDQDNILSGFVHAVTVRRLRTYRKAMARWECYPWKLLKLTSAHTPKPTEGVRKEEMTNDTFALDREVFARRNAAVGWVQSIHGTSERLTAKILYDLGSLRMKSSSGIASASQYRLSAAVSGSRAWRYF